VRTSLMLLTMLTRLVPKCRAKSAAIDFVGIGCLTVTLFHAPAAAAVEIRAKDAQGCPTESAVASRLLAVTSAQVISGAEALSATVSIDPSGILVVSLRRASGALVGGKSLPAPPCVRRPS
jgi:hypothetical protein